jgi:hypothetical protein
MPFARNRALNRYEFDALEQPCLRGSVLESEIGEHLTVSLNLIPKLQQSNRSRYIVLPLPYSSNVPVDNGQDITFPGVNFPALPLFRLFGIEPAEPAAAGQVGVAGCWAIYPEESGSYAIRAQLLLDRLRIAVTISATPKYPSKVLGPFGGRSSPASLFLSRNSDSRPPRYFTPLKASRFTPGKGIIRR